MTHENKDETCHLLKRNCEVGNLTTYCGVEMNDFPAGHWIAGTVGEVDCPKCITVIDGILKSVADLEARGAT